MTQEFSAKHTEVCFSLYVRKEKKQEKSTSVQTKHVFNHTVIPWSNWTPTPKAEAASGVVAGQLIHQVELGSNLGCKIQANTQWQHLLGQGKTSVHSTSLIYLYSKQQSTAELQHDKTIRQKNCQKHSQRGVSISHFHIPEVFISALEPPILVPSASAKVLHSPFLELGSLWTASDLVLFVPAWRWGRS